MSRWTPDTVADRAAARWVVSLQWAGRTWRLGSEAVVVASDAGPIDVLSALTSLDWEDSAELALESGVEGGFATAAVSLVLPVDVAAEVDAGHRLDGAAVEVALLAEGQTWEARRVVLVGVVVDPVYGYAGQPVSFSADSSAADDHGTVLAELLGDGAWPDYPFEQAVVWGPLVFGRPGETDSGARYAATTGVVVDDSGTRRLLVAAHEVPGGTVQIRDDDDDLGEWLARSITTTASSRGTLASLVDLPDQQLAVGQLLVQPAAVGALTGAVLSFGDVDLTGVGGPRTPGSDNFNGTLLTQAALATEIAAAINDAANTLDTVVTAVAAGAAVALTATVGGSDGGVSVTSSVAAVTTTGLEGASDQWATDHTFSVAWTSGAMFGVACTAGELLEYLLVRSTLRIDRGRLRAALPLLEPFILAGSVEEQTTPIDWIRAHLLPILPVSLVSGPEGLWPLVTRWDAVARDAIGVVDVEQDGLELVGGASLLGEPASELEIAYARDLRLDEYTERATLTGAASVASSNVYTRASYTRHGRRALPAIESDVIASERTARRVLAWRSIAHWTRHRQVAYRGARSYIGWLAPGDVVELTDEALAIRGRLALVSSVVGHADASPTVRLLVLERPPDVG